MTRRVTQDAEATRLGVFLFSGKALAAIRVTKRLTGAVVAPEDVSDDAGSDALTLVFGSPRTHGNYPAVSSAAQIDNRSSIADCISGYDGLRRRRCRPERWPIQVHCVRRLLELIKRRSFNGIR